MKAAAKLTKVEALAYLLGAFGSGAITREQFWGQMKERGYTQIDIDNWCDRYHKLSAAKEKTNGGK
jgi:hypothetical protein